MLRGGRRIIVLFILTIVSAVSFHQFLHMPPVLGMLHGTQVSSDIWITI